MKAIRVSRFGGPEVLELQDVSVPEPGPEQVLVRVHAIGVNPVDTYWRAGLNPSLSLPFTPGLDASGVVEAVGPGVQSWKKGARVYLGGSVSGTYAEWVTVRAMRLFPLPESVSFDEGAALHVPYATAHRALFHRAQARSGEWVLVHGGSGGVGLAAIQFARAAGLTVIATAGSEAGIQLVKQHGAHYVLNHRDSGYLSQVQSITHGRGVDIVLEMLANVNLGKDLSLVSSAGRVVVIGSRGPVEVTPRDLMTREADIRGMSLFNVSEEALQGIHRAVCAGLENRTLRPVIRQKLPLSEAATAHRLVMEPGATGKILLSPNESL